MHVSILDAEHLVQAKRIRRWQAVTPGFSRLISFKRHVNDKKCDQYAKSTRHVAGDDNQDHKDHNMRKGLLKLAVIHSAHARDQA